MGSAVFQHSKLPWITMRFHLTFSFLSRLSVAGMLALSGWSAIAADTPTYTAPATPAAPERIAAARAAIQAKDWKKAISELNVAVKEQPKNADAHNLLAYSHRKQAQPNLPKAFEHYKIALQLDPKHKGAHEYIGEAYLMNKEPVEAEKHLATLAQLCGNKTCEEYADLAKSLADYRAKNK
jgi:Tfp pilus assembly protein PilF